MNTNQLSDNKAAALEEKIASLAPWFHNLHFPGGVQTNPQHFLGDFPSFKWKEIAPYIPEDLSGWSALDIGCNAGFYSFEMARRGAQVTGIDLDPHYLRQAAWAAEQYGLQDQVNFQKMQVYDLARQEKEYDLVWFMGVFYHLRYPMLALDIIAQKTKKMLVFQTLTMPGKEVHQPAPDYSINDRAQMLLPGWPKMAFIEEKLNGDPTNWWAPNHAGIEAMLRSCGFKVLHRPGHETYICVPDPERTGVASGWNRSEYLSAIGQDWEAELNAKVEGKNSIG